jgi:predicted enzyme related to lactoylglutathione lyase
MTDLDLTLNLLKIPVIDFKRACAFYRDILGLEEDFAVEEYGWAQYQLGDVPLCLYVVGMGGGDGKPGNELNFHLAVDDAPKALAALKSKTPTSSANSSPATTAENSSSSPTPTTTPSKSSSVPDASAGRGENERDPQSKIKNQTHSYSPGFTTP